MQNYFKSVFNFIQCQTSTLKCITCFIDSFKHTESVTLSSEICNKRGQGRQGVHSGRPAGDEQHTLCFLGVMARKLFFFFNRGFTVCKGELPSQS